METSGSLIICRGLPASGKTSWTLEQLKRNPDGAIRANRDELRFGMFGQYVLHEQWKENVVTKQQASIIRQGLLMKKKVYVDDTNLSSRTVRRLLEVLVEFDGAVDFRFQDFAVNINECVRRDNGRKDNGDRYVGEDVIRNMAKRYHVDYDGSLPSLGNDIWNSVKKPEPLVQDETLPSAWLVDFDGTIAQMGDRSPYAWDRVDEDEPIWNAIRMVKDLKAAGHKIIIVSGRDAVCRKQSEEWLNVYEVPYDDFLMRPENDMRKDNIVKKEIFETHIFGKYNIVGCMDDREQVVQQYRKMGLFVAQVANGAF